MFGLLPPSSQGDALEVRFGRRLHDDLGRSVHSPVKATLSTSMCAPRAAPAVGPKPGTTLMTPSGKPASWASSPIAQGGQRRLLGRLEHDGAAGRQRRAPLPRLHQQREIPRDDLPDHADRLVPRVAEIVALDRDRLAVDLVGPAGVVAVAFDGQRQVGVEASRDRLAVVERFEGRQFFDVSSRSGRPAC